MSAELRLGLVGHNIAASLSPRLHRAGLAAIGRKGDYRCFDVDNEADAVAVFERVRRGELDGVNVTTPYKALLARHVDRASVVGPLNTLWRARDGSGALVGASSDGPGLRTAIVAALADRAGAEVVGIEGVRIGIYGSGGAAHAIARDVVTAGAALVWLRARRLAAAARVVGDVGVGAALGWDAPGEGVDVVVHATRLGHGGGALDPSGQTSLAQIVRQVVADGAGLFDVVYAPPPAPTPLEALAAACGLTATTGPAGAAWLARAAGAEMLVAQAALSLSWWTGEVPPLAAMRAEIGLPERTTSGAFAERQAATRST